MAYDLLIRNGSVIDGTGARARRADVGVVNGKLADIGSVSGPAKRTIDASDLVVAPGFIDPHTHYDAQICWDGGLTPSSWHGVTSVVMGNCGVGIAPCKPAAREIAMRDLVNVEAIPFEVLAAGLHGAMPTPQLPITTEVTPCHDEGVSAPSQQICAS